MAKSHRKLTADQKSTIVRRHLKEEPINAKLFVQDDFMFAITMKKPGGVVVSSRERLPLLAKVE